MLLRTDRLDYGDTRYGDAPDGVALVVWIIRARGDLASDGPLAATLSSLLNHTALLHHAAAHGPSASRGRETPAAYGPNDAKLLPSVWLVPLDCAPEEVKTAVRYAVADDRIHVMNAPPRGLRPAQIVRDVAQRVLHAHPDGDVLPVCVHAGTVLERPTLARLCTHWAHEARRSAGASTCVSLFATASFEKRTKRFIIGPGTPLNAGGNVRAANSRPVLAWHERTLAAWLLSALGDGGDVRPWDDDILLLNPLWRDGPLAGTVRAGVVRGARRARPADATLWGELVARTDAAWTAHAARYALAWRSLALVGQQLAQFLLALVTVALLLGSFQRPLPEARESYAPVNVAAAAVTLGLGLALLLGIGYRRFTCAKRELALVLPRGQRNHLAALLVFWPAVTLMTALWWFGWWWTRTVQAAARFVRG